HDWLLTVVHTRVGAPRELPDFPSRRSSDRGSSKVFLGGITAYAGAPKMSLLGVERDTLREHGSVAEQTVLAMARGARRAFEADRSEEHTSELQSREKLVCRLLLEDKNDIRV